MAQTAAKRVARGWYVDYTPASAVSGGDVVLIGNIPHVAEIDIAANAAGAVSCEGIYDIPKTTDVFTAGDPVFWSSSATDVGNNTGAADNATGVYMGYATANAANTDAYVRTKITRDKQDGWSSVNANGGNIATAAAITAGFTVVSGSDNAKGIQLPIAAKNTRCVVINQNTDKTLKVYPPVGAQINGLGANNAATLAANATGTFIASDSNTYRAWTGSGIVA